eukprot:6212638-Pleurochrysis_carterae.AAC.5
MTSRSRRMRMPAELATAARARNEVGRIFARKCATTLPLVDPYQAHQGSVRGNLQGVNDCPTPVCRMIRYFRALRLPPTDAVLRHRLLTRPWVLCHRGHRKRAACATPPARFPVARPLREHGGAAGA